MWRALCAVVIVALVSYTNAAVCNGYNVTINPQTSGHVCPFGYYFDATYYRCLSYSDIINNYLGAPCSLDAECGPVSSFQNTPLFKCGAPEGRCTWYNTRMPGDSCEHSINCYQVANTLGISYGCDNSTKVCREVLPVYGKLNDKCGYVLHAKSYTCQDPDFYCNKTIIPFPLCNQRVLIELGNNCTATDVCRSGFCFNDIKATPSRRYCSNKRAVGESCFSTSDCDGGYLSTFCNTTASVCQNKRQVDERCTLFGDECDSKLQCDYTSFTCRPYGGYLEKAPCDPLSGLALYTYNNTCYRGEVGDSCSKTAAECSRRDNICYNNVCIPRISRGASCAGTLKNGCQDGLRCYQDICTAYQQLGEACDTTSNLSFNNPLVCNTTLSCSRGKCIKQYSLGLGALCQVDSDCFTSFCDATTKRCSRKMTCTSSSLTCACLCSAGVDNRGLCVSDYCLAPRYELFTCLQGSNYSISMTTPAPSSYFTGDVFLDVDSNLYKNCSSQHHRYVSCQATQVHSAYAPATLPIPTTGIRGYAYQTDLGNSGMNLRSGAWTLLFVAIVSLLILN
ncbi:developmentally-regulated external PM-anchored protein [Acrasis kona]|uniref:Developmentally-regulated external PM-anchored protein n=1 Tax=Acrasis kona TaxID=1008807 RepID=A0AAW2ZB93_9EUKA